MSINPIIRSIPLLIVTPTRAVNMKRRAVGHGVFKRAKNCNLFYNVTLPTRRYSYRNKVSQFQHMINRQESGNHGLFKVLYRQSLRNGLISKVKMYGKDLRSTDESRTSISGPSPSIIARRVSACDSLHHKFLKCTRLKFLRDTQTLKQVCSRTRPICRQTHLNCSQSFT
jgi:hypothetical protein